jgi:hypothetical protein
MCNSGGRCALWNSHSPSLYILGTGLTENVASFIVACVSDAAILIYLAVSTQRTISSVFQPLCHSILTPLWQFILVWVMCVSILQSVNVPCLPYRYVLSKVHSHASRCVGCSQLDIPAGAC